MTQHFGGGTEKLITPNFLKEDIAQFANLGERERKQKTKAGSHLWAEGNFPQVYGRWETFLFYLYYLFLLLYLRSGQQCTGASDSSKTVSLRKIINFHSAFFQTSTYLWIELPSVCQPLCLPADKGESGFYTLSPYRGCNLILKQIQGLFNIKEICSSE